MFSWAGAGGKPMRWIGLLCVGLGAVILAANAFGDRSEAAAGGPVIGGIVIVCGLLLLAGGGRRD
jgi:hypothetical protein